MSNIKSKDAALAAIIIGMHYNSICKAKNLDQLERLGIYGFEKIEKLTEISMDFCEKTKDINWEEFIENPEKFGFSPTVCDFEDAAISHLEQHLDGMH